MSRLPQTTVVIFTIWILLALAVPAWAGLGAQETPLSPAGLAYEINLDSQGTLWISDGIAGEIRAFDSSSGAYTTYLVNGVPSDARGDGTGDAWWADFNSNQLGRLSASANQATIWEIPGSTGLFGTTIDNSGDVWVSDCCDAFIYELDPDTNQLCTYALPDGGMSEYLYHNGQQLWFGDYVNGRIVRLEGATFTWWTLPSGSYPRELALDGSGKVWWTDTDGGYIGRLDPVAGEITTFTPPTAGSPLMLALVSGKVWYSQQDPGGVVVLDPAVATGTQTPFKIGRAHV